MATTQEVEQYILYLKRKVLKCVAIAIIRLAYKQKKLPQEYAAEFQVLYLKNDDTINPLLKQKLVSSFQDNLITKLYKTVPLLTNGSKLHSASSEEMKSTASGTDLFNISSPTKVVNKKLLRLEAEIKSSTERNIQFIQAITRLKTVVDRKPKISTSLLETILSLNGDNVSQGNPSQSVTRRSLTDDDSGVFLSESYNTNSVDFVSSNSLKFVLHTSDIDILLVQSAKCVLHFIEKELKYRSVNYFNFWKGSIVDHAVNIVSNTCDANEELFAMVYKFICSILEDIWNNEEIGKHEVFESQIHILGEFINNLELSIQLMNFVGDKLESALTKVNVYFYYANKLINMLVFCDNLVDKYKLLKVKSKYKDKEVEKYDITTLWKRHYLNGQDLNESKTVEKETTDRLIRILERLLITYSSNCPLLSKPIVKCLTCIKILDNKSNDIEMEVLNV